MTDVFAERLHSPCWVFRVGASAPFPATYDYSVTVETREFEDMPGRIWSVPVGFDHPKVSRADFVDTIRTINRVTGNLVAYDRAGPPPTRVFQIDPGLTNGKIVMTHRKPHQADHATAADGTVDKKAVAAELRHVADLLDADKIDIRNMAETPVGDGWDRLTVERKLHPSLT